MMTSFKVIIILSGLVAMTAAYPPEQLLNLLAQDFLPEETKESTPDSSPDALKQMMMANMMQDLLEEDEDREDSTPDLIKKGKAQKCGHSLISFSPLATSRTATRRNVWRNATR